MVKVGLIQTKEYSSNKNGIVKVSKFLEQLGKKKTRIACLPEQWLPNNKIDDFDSEFKNFKYIARKYQMTIIPGAFYHNTRNKWIISSPIISHEGEIIGYQEKIHPFDYEKKIVEPGGEAKIFNTTCKFGVVICYDMVFPKVS